MRRGLQMIPNRIAQLGGGGLNVFGGVGNPWLMRDTFKTDRAVGAVNNTPADEGTGTRTVVDLTSSLSITGGTLQNVNAGGSGFDKVSVSYEDVPVTRKAGVTLFSRGKCDGNGGYYGMAVWKNAAGAFAATVASKTTAGIWLVNPTILATDSSGALVNAGSRYTQTKYSNLAVMLLSAGAAIFAQDATQLTAWTLLWIYRTGTDTPVYAAMRVGPLGGTGNIDEMRVQDAGFVPQSLANDTFNRANAGTLGSTDGAVWTDLGGSGKTWTNQLGAWGITSNKAQPASLDGGTGLAVATVDLGVTRPLFYCTPTRSAGVVGLVGWWTDVNNHIRAVRTAAGLVLSKFVGGTETVLQTLVETFGELTLSFHGTKITAYTAGKPTTEFTVTDVTPTSVFGIISDNTGNTMDTMYAFNRVADYSALSNAFAPMQNLTFEAVGDSKGTSYAAGLVASITTVTDTWTASTAGYSGYTTAQIKAAIDARITALAGQSPRWVFINTGSNDLLSMPSQASAEADLGYIADAYHTAFPATKVRFMRPAIRGRMTEANTFAGYIANVIAARAAWCGDGPDERVYLENGDNFTTRTNDGVHQNAAGDAAEAALCKTIMGL